VPFVANLQDFKLKSELYFLVQLNKGREMKVHWLTDADAALAEAKTQKKPLLVDFSAAPA
jgi:uncharacterized protein YyaL (SSP411 family)